MLSLLRLATRNRACVGGIELSGFVPSTPVLNNLTSCIIFRYLSTYSIRSFPPDAGRETGTRHPWLSGSTSESLRECIEDCLNRVPSWRESSCHQVQVWELPNPTEGRFQHIYKLSRDRQPSDKPRLNTNMLTEWQELLLAQPVVGTPKLK